MSEARGSSSPQLTSHISCRRDDSSRTIHTACCTLRCAATRHDGVAAPCSARSVLAWVLVQRRGHERARLA
eukprot:4663022-Pleurochrysis_carterae.AAC.3